MSSSLQEAQKFVDQFIKGEYTPEEHAVFLQWLKGATSEELKIISEMYESKEEEWRLPWGPSAEWVMRLEQKLDESEKPRRDDRVSTPSIFIRPLRIGVRVWVAAAAVVLLVTGTYIYLQKTGSGVEKKVDQQALQYLAVVNPPGGAQKEIQLPDG